MSCSKLESGRYLDQANKRIYTVDHLRGEIISVEETTVELVDSVEELLTHLSAASAKYAETYYKEPFGSHGTFGGMLSIHGPDRGGPGRLCRHHKQERAVGQLLHG